MPSNKQVFNFLICATIASAWPALGHFDSSIAWAQKPSKSGVIAEKSSPAKVTEEKEEEEEAGNRPGLIKQIKVFIDEGDSVVMHSGTEEVKLESTRQVAIKGKTYFVVTGDVRFGYPGQEPGLVGASSVHANGREVVTYNPGGSFEIRGTTVRVDFDLSPDVSVCDAREAVVFDGSSLIATNCQNAAAREGAKLVATGCKHVEGWAGSKITAKDCRNVKFMRDASGTASGCNEFTVRDTSAECDNCETVHVWGESKVKTSNCSTVEVWGDAAEVAAYGAKSIQAWGKSKVKYDGDPKIKTYDNATVSKM